MLSRKDIDLYLVYITVHLDILGYSIVLPIMASFSESLGGTVDHTTALFSCYAITQFCSGFARLALILAICLWVLSVIATVESP